MRMWSSGYDARFTRERSRVRSPLSVLLFHFDPIGALSLKVLSPIKLVRIKIKSKIKLKIRYSIEVLRQDDSRDS